MQNEKNLIWIDMEMTGLNPDHDRILEIATIITDDQLDIIAEGPVVAVRQPQEILDQMSEWCQTHHTQSGLLDRCKAIGTTEAEAEKLTLDFIRKYVPEKTSPICGNSICQDRRFIFRYMPKLHDYLHYRNLDVSTIKILADLWKPQIMPGFSKKEAHLALEDIKESIEELRYYRKHFFNI
jgi:oligoribonuclease